MEQIHAELERAFIEVEEAAANLRRLLEEDIERSRLTSSPDDVQLIGERLRAAVDDVVRDTQLLRSAIPMPTEDGIRYEEFLKLQSLFRAADMDGERITQLISSAKQRSQRAGHRQIFQGLQSFTSGAIVLQIKRIGVFLWALISKYLRLKEWKVTGSVGTGFLGLADASIELTFGP